MRIVLLLCVFLVSSVTSTLHPSPSETREVLSLDGLWNVLKDNEKEGIGKKWFKNNLNWRVPTKNFPVPSSEKDDHIFGIGAWYDRNYFIPLRWREKTKVWIQFGKLKAEAIVWINGRIAGKKTSSLTVPLHFEITEYVKFGKENRITVFLQSGDSSYLNIPESVVVFTTPETFIEDIKISTDLIANIGYLFFNVTHSLNKSKLNTTILVRDRQNILVANEKSMGSGVIRIDDIKPWWPNLMHSDPGYLYSVEVRVTSDNHTLLDSYKLKTGFRTLKWDTTDLMVNGKIMYLHGFGFNKTETPWNDLSSIANLNGNLILANEDVLSQSLLEMADELGLMVVVNCYGKIDSFDQISLNSHKSAIENALKNYMNHPSIMVWSLGAVADLNSFGGTSYFKIIKTFTHSLDPNRPITAIVNAFDIENNIDYQFAHYLDIISLSIQIEEGTLNISTLAKKGIEWNEKYNRPVIVAQYGKEMYKTLDRFGDSFDIMKDHKALIGEILNSYQEFNDFCKYSTINGTEYLSEIGSRYISFYPPGRKN
ncbi:GUSB family protein [Megaselia abdita]